MKSIMINVLAAWFGSGAFASQTDINDITIGAAGSWVMLKLVRSFRAAQSGGSVVRRLLEILEIVAAVLAGGIPVAMTWAVDAPLIAALLLV